MSGRITKERLQKIAANCQRLMPCEGWTYSIEYAYGRPRLVMEDAKLCCRDVSPRLPAGKLAEWIWAYIKGAEDFRQSICSNHGVPRQTRKEAA